MRATIKDISRHAGVSTATVDRVINGRDGVKPRTRNQVLASAAALGYIQPETEIAPPRPVTLGILLPEGTNAFIAKLGEQLQRETDEFEAVTVKIEHLQAFDPAALAQRLKVLAKTCDGIAMIAIDHPLVREAMHWLSSKGIPVVTLLSDIPEAKRIEYVGIENIQAGRMAGFVLAKFLPPGQQKVALFTGSLAFRGHQEREMGFRQILAQEMPHLAIADMIETREDRDIAYTAASALLENHPDLAGIYNAGGATIGIAKALKEKGKAHQVHFIAHEVTEDNKSLLLDGTIDACIDQNTAVAARETVSALTNAIRRIAHRPYPSRLHMVFRENLPIPD